MPTPTTPPPAVLRAETPVIRARASLDPRQLERMMGLFAEAIYGEIFVLPDDKYPPDIVAFSLTVQPGGGAVLQLSLR